MRARERESGGHGMQQNDQLQIVLRSKVQKHEVTFRTYRRAPTSCVLEKAVRGKSRVQEEHRRLS